MHSKSDRQNGIPETTAGTGRKSIKGALPTAWLPALALSALVLPGHGAVRPLVPLMAGSVCQAIGDRFPVPGRIQFEDYKPGGQGVGYNDLTAGNSGGAYRSDNVDISSTPDVGGGYEIGWTQAGEWLAYDINVAVSGMYSLSARLSSAVGGTKTITFAVDGANVGSLNYTDASGWQSWKTASLSNLNLTAGNHVLRVTMNTGNINLNYVDWSRQLSSNNNLAGLTITDGILSPAFSSATLSYQAYVTYGVESVLITPTASEPSKATVTINGRSVPAGQAYQLALATGANLATVTVRAENGSTRAHSLTVTRGAMWPQVSAGGYHSLVLNRYGELFAAGKGTNGQLADPNLANRNSPSFIDMGPILSNLGQTALTAIAAGENHSLVDIGKYYVYGFGANGNNQLGNGATLVPSPVSIHSGASNIAAGGAHNLFGDPAAALFGIGSNWEGQIAQPGVGNYYLPMVIAYNPKTASAGAKHSLFVSEGGTAYSFGYNNRGQLGNGSTLLSRTPVTVMSGVWKVSAGSYSSMFLKTDGTLWATGANDYGQLGDGTTISRLTPVYVTNQVSAVAAGSTHTLILKADGTLWAFGRNNQGQLGDGSYTDRTSPVQVMANVSSMSAGQNFSLAVKRDGTIWSVGWNGEGALADGSNATRPTFTQISGGALAAIDNGSYTLVVKEDGRLWAIGGNTPQGSMLPPRMLLAGGVTGVARGTTHTLAVKSDGTLWAAGSNDQGQFGNGTTLPSSSYIQVFTNVASVAAGDYSTIALRKDGTLWVAGAGELGDGGSANRTRFVQVASGVKKVSASLWHTMFIKTDGTLWGMGWDQFGAIGPGGSTHTLTPVQVGTNVTDVSAGYYHTLFTKTDNTVWGMGSNSFGQLANSELWTGTSTPVQIGLTGVVKVFAAEKHSMFVKTDGTAWACGTNEFFQLGNNNPTTLVISPVQVMSNVRSITGGRVSSLWITNNSELYVSGSNGNFPLGAPWAYPHPFTGTSVLYKPTRAPLL